MYRVATGTSGDAMTSTAGGTTNIGAFLLEFVSASTTAPLYGYNNAWVTGSPCKIAATPGTYLFYIDSGDTVGPFGFITGTALPEGPSTYSYFLSPVFNSSTYTLCDPTTLGATEFAFGVNHS